MGETLAVVSYYRGGGGGLSSGRGVFYLCCEELVGEEEVEQVVLYVPKGKTRRREGKITSKQFSGGRSNGGPG